MKGKKLLAGLLSVILAFNSNAAVLAVGEDGGSVSDPPAPPAAHTVTIEASPETPAAGDEVILTASGVEDADSLQWQEMEADWTDIEGAASETYSFTWTEELETASFRLAASWEGEDESVETVYSDALTLTAKWTANTYTISFSSEGGGDFGIGVAGFEQAVADIKNGFAWENGEGKDVATVAGGEKSEDVRWGHGFFEVVFAGFEGLIGEIKAVIDLKNQ